MTNSYGINFPANNQRDMQGQFRDSRGGGNMLMGLMSFFGGGMFGGGSMGCEMDGSMRGGRHGNSVFGGHRSQQTYSHNRGYESNPYGQEYGREYGGSYGQEYGQGYGQEYGREREYGNQGCRQNSAGNFMENMLTGLGLAVFAKAIISAFSPKQNQNVNNANTQYNVNQQPFVNNPNASDKYAQLNDWSDRTIMGEQCPNLDIAKPEYRELMDAYHAGGDKDKAKRAEAQLIYTNDIKTLARDSMKPYDKNNDGILDKTEFWAKSMDECKHDAELYGQPFNSEQAARATEIAFSRLSKDGNTITENDLAVIYALADSKSEGHDGITKGSIDFSAYGSVSTDLGSPDVLQDGTKNDIGTQIKGAYDFFFPKAA